MASKSLARRSTPAPMAGRSPSSGDVVVAASDAPTMEAPTGPIDINAMIEPPKQIIPGDVYTTEVGYKGLLQTGGFIYEEWVNRLRGWEGARMFQEMADNDAIMGGMIYAVSMMIQQIEWGIVPADKSPAAIDAAEWVKGALFEDMDDSWSSMLGELMMTAPVHGYAVFEIVWKIRKGKTHDKRTNSLFDDNKIAPRRLAPRSPLSILRWEIDRDGDVLGVWQNLLNMGTVMPSAPSPFQGVTPGMAYIPAEKYLNFGWNRTRGNPEGRSMLRGCYINYLRKKTLEDAEGRLALRSAGIVLLTVPSTYMDPNADSKIKAAMLTIGTAAMRIAQDRAGAITLPSDTVPGKDGTPTSVKQFGIEFITADRRTTQDTGTIIERLDASNAMTMLADFMLLGHGKSNSGGSHAQNSSKTDTFMTALGAIAQSIADEVNRGLIARMWAYNGMDDKIRPKLVPGEITPPDLGKLGSLLLNLAQSGFELAPDTVLQNAIRKMAHLPEVQDDGLAELAADAAARQKLQAAIQMPGDPEPGGDAPQVPGVAGKNGQPQGGGAPPAPGQPKPSGAAGGPPKVPGHPGFGMIPQKPKVKPTPEMLAAVSGKS